MAGLYVHIPFCVKKCAYCDFVSFVSNDDLKRAYIDALIAEAGLYPRSAFDTVFIGGGTPSILPLGELTRLVTALYKHFDISSDAEFTVECNPGTLCQEKLTEYRNMGVNRLSIGLQSANDRVLNEIGRIHVFSDFLSSIELARAAGFVNINADIMYGLPSQSIDDFKDTLDAICALGLTHISAYSLILEEHTPLFYAVRRGEKALPCEDDEYAMHVISRKRLAERGYSRYEISNYALPGMKCRHNLNYWDCGEYLGLGVNAHSANMRNAWTRWSNVSTLSEYIALISEGKRPIAESSTETCADERFEYIMLGLRKTDGISISSFIKRFGVSPLDLYQNSVETCTANGWLLIDNDRMKLTETGLDLQNDALMEFMD